MSSGSRSLLSTALIGDCGPATTSSSLSTGSVLAETVLPRNHHMENNPGNSAPSASQVAIPRTIRRCSLSESQMETSYPPMGLSRLVLDRRTSNPGAATGNYSTERPTFSYRASNASAGSLSGDSTVSFGTRQNKLERLQVETVCRFLVSAAGLVHALQAERGASVTYVASFGQTMCDKLPSFHETTNRRLRKLADAFTLYEEMKPVNVQNIEALRQAVMMRTLSYDQVIGMYTTMVQALLETMAVASRPLQNTEVSQKVTSLLIFQRMKEAAALQRGTVSGIAASGQLMINPQLHYALLSNLGEDFLRLALTPVALAIAYFKTCSLNRCSDHCPPDSHRCSSEHGCLFHSIQNASGPRNISHVQRTYSKYAVNGENLCRFLISL